jgi:exodeoxyribonuclease III
MEGDNLKAYINNTNPDIICLAETKVIESEVMAAGLLSKFKEWGYSYYWNHAKDRRGYSGTCILSKYKPIKVFNDIGIAKHDREGRVITTEFEKFFLVCCYIPNSGKTRFDYRIQEWDPDFRAFLNKLRAKKGVVVCGDLNVVHEKVDMSSKYYTRTNMPGLRPQERRNLNDLIQGGWIDSFRHLNPTTIKYSWFFTYEKPENLGLRLDYFLVSKEITDCMTVAGIATEQDGSDHVPIELTIDVSKIAGECTSVNVPSSEVIKPRQQEIFSRMHSAPDLTFEAKNPVEDASETSDNIGAPLSVESEPLTEQNRTEDIPEMKVTVDNETISNHIECKTSTAIQIDQTNADIDILLSAFICK